MAAPGSILGAVLASGAEPGIFGVLLAAALIVAAAYVFIRPRLSSRPTSNTQAVAVLSVAASFFAGIVSSYFGIGGGVVFVPLLVVMLGMSMMRAAPTSMFALLVTSAAGVAMHALLGHTDAVLALLLSAGGLLGGLAGGSHIGSHGREVPQDYCRRADDSGLQVRLVGDAVWTNTQ